MDYMEERERGKECSESNGVCFKKNDMKPPHFISIFYSRCFALSYDILLCSLLSCASTSPCLLLFLILIMLFQIVLNLSQSKAKTMVHQTFKL